MKVKIYKIYKHKKTDIKINISFLYSKDIASRQYTNRDFSNKKYMQIAPFAQEI